MKKTLLLLAVVAMAACDKKTTDILNQDKQYYKITYKMDCWCNSGCVFYYDSVFTEKIIKSLTDTLVLNQHKEKSFTVEVAKQGVSIYQINGDNLVTNGDTLQAQIWINDTLKTTKKAANTVETYYP